MDKFSWLRFHRDLDIAMAYLIEKEGKLPSQTSVMELARISFENMKKEISKDSKRRFTNIRDIMKEIESGNVKEGETLYLDENEDITPEQITKIVEKEFKKPMVKRAFSQLDREFSKLNLKDFEGVDE
jgi:hypothetical protein